MGDRLVRFVSDYAYEHKIKPPRKDMTYIEVFDEVIAPQYDKVRSVQEYKDIATKIIDVIKEQHGIHLLRVYCYYPYIDTYRYEGFESHDLYAHSIQDVHKTVQSLLSFIGVTHKDDKKLLTDFLLDEFDEKYGFIKQSTRLAYIIKLMQRNFSDVTYKHFLEKDLKRILQEEGDKYFIKKDLTQFENFNELYVAFGEQYGFFEFRRGIYCRYDGYGNVIFGE